MPILIVLMRIAIIMPLQKYLLSTMPQSFLLISVQMSLQYPKHVLFLLFSSPPLSSSWFSSLPVSFTASSSSSSLFAESPAALIPFVSAHTGQSSGFWGTAKLMELASGWELWSCLLWCGQKDARHIKTWEWKEHKTTDALGFQIQMLFCNANYYKSLKFLQKL